MSPSILIALFLIPAVVGGPVHAEVEAHEAIRTIAVTDGYPITGIEGGVIFAQRFDDDCRLVPLFPAAEDRPFAGSVTGKTQLTVAVSTMSCPPASEEPTVRCRWAIAGTARSGEAAWQGREGRIVVDLPDRTGIYRTSISCTIDGSPRSPLEVAPTLFVTYDDPQLSSPDRQPGPIEKDWLKRACSWGAGFGAEARDVAILTKMLNELYNYGKEHWQYGYFPDNQGGQGIYQPECVERENHRWCDCTWQALVADNTSCRYGSCYEFSKVFEHMAETLGIGGFEEVKLRGSGDAGFAAVPGLRSFDPEFPTNVECEDRALPCPPYVLGSHSLRLRDGIYYDATFNRIYEQEDEFIAQNVSFWGDIVTFMDSPSVMCLQYTGYGDWWYYLRPSTNSSFPADAASCPSDDSRPARFTGQVGLLPADPNGGEGSRASIAAGVEIEILKEGRYAINASLYSHGSWIFHRPQVVPRFTTARFSGRPGRQMARLRFPAPAGICNEIEGPYQLILTLFSKKGRVETRIWDFPAIAGWHDD